MRGAAAAGYSLIEVMVVVAIVGVLGTLGSRLMRSIDEGEMQAKARSAANQQNEALMRLIDRDLRFRSNNTSYLLAPQGLGITVTRRQSLDLSDLDAADQSYQVGFISRCMPRPPRLNTFQGLKTQLQSPRLASAGACLKRLNCNNGQMPEVQINLAGAGQIPPYPNRTYPAQVGAADSIGDRALGQAVCFEATAEQIHISIDTIYPSGREFYQVISHEKSIPLTVKDFQILPH